MDAMAGVVGELAAAVGYQQVILWCNPVGVENKVRVLK